MRQIEIKCFEYYVMPGSTTLSCANALFCIAVDLQITAYFYYLNCTEENNSPTAQPANIIRGCTTVPAGFGSVMQNWPAGDHKHVESEQPELGH
jgi:hypothetical protein